METNNNYDLSFFKPANPHSRANRNLVLVLVIVWLVAVFGFQFLLKFIEEPTPEKSLTKYEQVNEAVYNNSATLQDKQQYVWSVMSLLGKHIKADERLAINNAVTTVIYDILPADKRDKTVDKLAEIKMDKEGLNELEGEEHAKKLAGIREKEKTFIKNIAGDLDLKENSLRAKLLPVVLNADFVESPISKYKDETNKLMNLYLIHNQSVLTDTIFLGFPFHYFYTAVFLLMLFVFLCWLYAIRIKKLNQKYGIE